MFVECEKFTEQSCKNVINSGKRTVDLKKLGRQIRKARKAASITQEVLADRVCVSQSYIAKLERGGTDNPGSKIIMAIAETLGVSQGWLFYDRDDIDDLDNESLDIAVMYNRLPEKEREAIKIMLTAVSKNKKTPEENN